MNIKVPNGMKNPTVVIVGNNSDDKKNDFVSRRMDILEKNLDRQYESFQNHKDYIKVLERLQKSFMDKLEKIILSNNSIKDSYEKRVSNLRKELSNKINELKSDDSSDVMLKTFAKKLTTLDNTIKNMPTQKIVRVVNNNNGNNLEKSFESMFLRLEKTIMKARPRMIPMPM